MARTAPSRRPNLGIVALAAVGLVVVGFSILIALDAAPSIDDPAEASEAHLHVPGFASEVAVSDDTQRELDAQLAAARRSVKGIVTTADAEARGYVPVTLDLAFLGVHYLKPEYLDRPFAPDRPTHLIFDRDGPEGRLIGLMYYVETGGDAPEGFAGPNDSWHNHQAACMGDGIMLALDDVTTATCSRLGGVVTPLSAEFASRWMVHVWVVPGNTNPWGVFADGNPALA
jgi:hypothetical protein